MMLPSKINKIISGGKYRYEIKYDGIRAIMRYLPKGFSIINRSGNDISYHFPEFESWGNGSMAIIDGEIVAFDMYGMSNFQMISERTHLTNEFKIKYKSKIHPVKFMAFDILWIEGKSCLPLPYLKRKELLKKYLEKHKIKNVCLVNEMKAKEEWVYRLRSKGYEGIVVKDIKSKYKSGEYWEGIPENHRTKRWLKYKFVNELDVIVKELEDNPAGKKAYCIYNDNIYKVQISGKQSKEISVGDKITIRYLKKTKKGRLREPVFKKKVI